MKNNCLKLKQTALVSALLLELTSVSQAATINVDGTLCNFNDAITAANTDTATGGCPAGTSGHDILELPAAATLNLSSTATVTSEISINGHNSILQPDPNNPAFRLINVYGALSIHQTTLQNGEDPVVGGVNVAYASILNLTESTIQNTTGGGVAIHKQSFAVVFLSTIKNTINTAPNYYGAGLTVGSSQVYIDDSTISNNNNLGGGAGGIWVNNYQSPTQLTISNSTISGNSNVTRGGGITHSDYGNGTTITLNNVTITGNSSAANGGGIANDNATINISQSLISGNTAVNGAEINSYVGPVIVDNHNIFGFNNNAGLVGVTPGPSDIVPTVPTVSDLLDPVLTNNGGLTATHALNPTGPAVDAVAAADCLFGGDQTGKSRPIDGDVDGTADCDVGAFENTNPDIIFEDGFD